MTDRPMIPSVESGEANMRRIRARRRESLKRLVEIAEADGQHQAARRYRERLEQMERGR